MRRGPSSAWNSSTKHCVGGRRSSQSLVEPPWPTGPRSVVFGNCALWPRRGFGAGRGLFVTSTAGVSVGGAGGSTGSFCCSSGAAAVSAGGVGGGGSTGGGGEREGGGASVGGGGDCNSSSGGGAERAAAFSRFCRWRRANLSQARQQRWTSTTKHSSFARILPVGSPTSPPSSKNTRQRLYASVATHLTFYCFLAFICGTRCDPRSAVLRTGLAPFHAIPRWVRPVAPGERCTTETPQRCGAPQQPC